VKLVLASFPQPSPTTPPHLTLLMKTFQTLFPPLSPHTLSLSSARRVVLVAYNPDKGTVDFRHFLITVKPYGVSKRVRRVLEGASTKASSSSKVYLDLGNEKDVADFFLRRKGEPGPGGSDGYESAASSASSVAGDDADAVSLADDYVGRNNKKGQKRAVRLDEIGPRMELRLIKITEGLPGKEGGVIFHEFVKKTKAEAAAQKAEHAAKEKLRRQRREEQERNVQRKKAMTGEQGSEKDSEGEGDQDAGEVDEPEVSDGGEEYEDEGAWDEDEEFSGGEMDGEQSDGSGDESDSEDEAPRPPPKKLKSGGKR